MKKEQPLIPEPFIARNNSEIIEASKSKYCPVPANQVLSEILKADNKEKFAVVGLPCHIHGIRKAEAFNTKLRNKIVLHFGLACAHTDNFLQTEYILHKYKIPKSEIRQLDYRGKGWPGSITIYLKNGQTIYIPLNEYMIYHSSFCFTPQRCALCADFINRFSDITFMDAWLPEYKATDHTGRSLIIVRNQIGLDICDRAKTDSIQIEPIDRTTVIRSQAKSRFSNADLAVQLAFSKWFRRPVPGYDIDIPPLTLKNVIRLSLANTNRWISSRKYLRFLIEPGLYVQSKIYRRIKSKINL